MRYNTFKMSISLEGDQPFENIPSIKAKALRIISMNIFTELLLKLVPVKRLLDIFLDLVAHLELLPKQ